MPVINYIQPNGEKTAVEVAVGANLMDAAIKSGVEGIIAECGGACSCATCHVYVADQWVDKIPAPNATEEAMLMFAEGREDNSRLSCQIRMTPDLDGMEVKVAEEQ